MINLSSSRCIGVNPISGPGTIMIGPKTLVDMVGNSGVALAHCLEIVVDFVSMLRKLGFREPTKGSSVSRDNRADGNVRNLIFVKQIVGQVIQDDCYI